MYLKVQEKGILKEILKKQNFKQNLYKLLDSRSIVVNGLRAKSLNQVIKAGDGIQIIKKSELSHGIYILYEDRDILVVEKPHGLLSVATDSKTEHKPSLHNILKHKRRTVWPCHRIDYSVSGVMLFATNQKSKEDLFTQFKEHSIERFYYALVEGRVQKYNGSWNDPLKELANSQVVVDPLGASAHTNYKVLRKTKHNSYLQIELKTGKKHQIRVHTSNAGHCIVGDFRYGATQNPVGRLCLHAQKIGFIHPRTKKKMTFLSAPPF